MNAAIKKANPGHNFDLQRVEGKFGKGYVLKDWNSVRDDYYSYSPQVAYNGFRREFIGVRAVDGLEYWVNDNINNPMPNTEFMNRVGLYPAFV